MFLGASMRLIALLSSSTGFLVSILLASCSQSQICCRLSGTGWWYGRGGRVDFHRWCNSCCLFLQANELVELSFTHFHPEGKERGLFLLSEERRSHFQKYSCITEVVYKSTWQCNWRLHHDGWAQSSRLTFSDFWDCDFVIFDDVVLTIFVEEVSWILERSKEENPSVSKAQIIWIHGTDLLEIMDYLRAKARCHLFCWAVLKWAGHTLYEWTWEYLLVTEAIVTLSSYIEE